jgi:hypothetical protein
MMKLVTNSRRLIDRLSGQKATLYHTDGIKSCAVQNSKSGRPMSVWVG